MNCSRQHIVSHFNPPPPTCTCPHTHPHTHHSSPPTPPLCPFLLSHQPRDRGAVPPLQETRPQASRLHLLTRLLPHTRTVHEPTLRPYHCTVRPATQRTDHIRLVRSDSQPLPSANQRGGEGEGGVPSVRRGWRRIHHGQRSAHTRPITTHTQPSHSPLSAAVLDSLTMAVCVCLICVCVCVSCGCWWVTTSMIRCCLLSLHKHCTNAVKAATVD